VNAVAVPLGAAATGATALRVLTQLRRDPRTVALLLLVPALLMTLLRYVFDGQPETFDRLGAPLIGLFPFITMFLVTSITMLRERTGGTLERLMSMPMAKLDLLSGYGLAFAAVAAVQAGITAGVAFLALGLDVQGSAVAVVALAVGNAVLGMALGLFVSAFASSEFQAVQFMPAFVLPQLILCGLFVPREEMASALEAASYALPLTYAFDALERVASGADFGSRGWADVVVVIGVTLLALALGALTLRRRTP
jgi:ABC-2 type transport system permease protein